MVSDLINRLGFQFSLCVPFVMTKMVMPHVRRTKHCHWPIRYFKCLARNATTRQIVTNLILNVSLLWCILQPHIMVDYIAIYIKSTMIKLKSRFLQAHMSKILIHQSILLYQALSWTCLFTIQPHLITSSSLIMAPQDLFLWL